MRPPPIQSDAPSLHMVLYAEGLVTQPSPIVPSGPVAKLPAPLAVMS